MESESSIRDYGPHGLPISSGYICTSRDCFGTYCRGTHYNYYLEKREDLVSITLDDKIFYITPEGYNVYYNKSLKYISRDIINDTDHKSPKHDRTFNEYEEPLAKRHKKY